MAHGRLMQTVLGGQAEFESELIRVRTGGRRAHGVTMEPKHGTLSRLIG